MSESVVPPSADRATFPPMAGLILLLVFTAGYAVQRGSICAVAAVEDLVRRRPQRFLACFACAAMALAVLAGSALLGRDMIASYYGSSAVLLPLLGGALFGVGSWVNGRCAFGTVAQLGGGDLARIGTLAGMLAGFAAAPRAGLLSPPTDIESPFVSVDPGLLLAGALALSIAIGWLVRKRLSWKLPDGDWHPLAAMGLIGLVNGVLLVLAAGWPYTSLLMDLAASTGMDLAWRALMAVIFVAGAICGALLSDGFGLEKGKAERWLRCIAGGWLMGLGATLVPGGNDTMLLVGLPLLLPNFLHAYLAMTAMLLALVIIARIRAGRSPAPA